MTAPVQGEVVLKLGPDAGSLVDYSCDFSEFVIEDLRATIVKAPTPGSPFADLKAAAASNQVRMTFLSTPHASTGLWLALYTASQTDTGELFFEVRYSTAAVSASNPKRTGYITVTSLMTGGAAYQPRRQSATVPARSVSGPLAS